MPVLVLNNVRKYISDLRQGLFASYRKLFKETFRIYTVFAFNPFSVGFYVSKTYSKGAEL